MNSSTLPSQTSSTAVAETHVPTARRSNRFARLPLLAGRSFIPLGLFARLPLAMLTVGALTLTTSVSGSYALGGIVAGAVGIGSALGAPLLGALADRRGQRPVLLAAAVLNALAVTALIAVASALGAAGSFPLGVFAAAFLAGASCPQVGPLARVRWMALTSGGARAGNTADLDTALSYESTADELTFVLGPALVGILASLVAPWLPLAVAAALTITLVPAFAVHRTHNAVPGSRAVARGSEVSGNRAVPPSSTDSGNRAVPRGSAVSAAGTTFPAVAALPVLAMVCMGTFFGSTQTALSAFGASFASSEAAGLLYAVMGLSSAATALSVAYWPRGFAVSVRWLVSAALMTALSFLLLVPASAGGMVAVLLILGLPVGPLMVTVFSIGGLVAPVGRLGTVMTALASGIVAGTALGSSLAGQLAQVHGYAAAFLVTVGAAMALLLLGLATAVVLRRRDARSSG
ncbi:MFS transporter [Arthrobacter sp. D1-29]